MQDCWGNIQKAFSVAFDFISKMFKAYVNGWITLFEMFINGLIGGVNNVIGGLNAVLDGMKTATGGVINLHVNPIPNVKLPKLAKGGIVMPSPGGTNVTVGEGGSPEAIIPLNKAHGLGMTVNVYVQSADPKAVVDAIKRYALQNGGLPNSLLRV